jgi:8-oxo-dGTP pyrophosphatase MutT (NUDIX family)
VRKTVVKALITDTDGRVLVLYRSTTHPNFPGQIDLPGGEMEEGENYLLALRREIVEEVGLDVSHVKDSHFIKLYEKVRSDKTVDILYRVTIPLLSEKDIQTSWEHKGFSIISLSDLLSVRKPSNLDVYMKEVLIFLKEEA